MANIFGSNFNDTLVGTATADSILGFDGNDLLEGQLGADTINGGNGRDTVSYFDNASVNVQLFQGFAIDAGGSTDILIGIEDVNGSSSNDTIVGDASGNLLRGLQGNDLLEGQLGADTIDGGSGRDTVSYFDNAGVTVRLDLGSATDAGGGIDVLIGIEDVNGSNSGDIIVGGAGANLVRGLGGGDTLDGGADNDTVVGGAGNDFLIGSGGNDRIFGESGADTLVGNAGRDRMSGGGGADTYRWDVAAEGGDIITDFLSGTDKLQIDASGFGGGLTESEDFASANRLVFSNTATQATGQFLYNQATGDLTWDANGTAAGGRLLLVTLNPGTALAADDLVVVA